MNGPRISTLPTRWNPLLAGARPEREQHVVGLGERARDERDADLVRPGGDLERDVLEAAVDRGDRGRLLLVDRLEVLFAADLSLETP